MVLETRKELFQYSDVNYKKFMEKLIPRSKNIIGVRMDKVRKISKSLFRNDDWENYVLSEDVSYQEELLIQGILIGLERKNLKKVCYLSEKFIPRINNWAVCDTFCSDLKITKKYKKEMLEFLVNFPKEKGEYVNRVIFVILLKYFIESEYLARIFELLDNIQDGRYYTNVAKAWLLAEVYAEYPDEIVVYMNNNKLKGFTFRCAIQKICESKKISEEEKEKIKKLKRD